MKLTNEKVVEVAVKCQRTYTGKYGISFEQYFKKALKNATHEEFKKSIGMSSHTYRLFQKIKAVSKAADINLKELDCKGLVLLSQATEIPDYIVLRVLVKRGFEYGDRFSNVISKHQISIKPRHTDEEVYQLSRKFEEYKKMFLEKKVTKLEVAITTYMVKSYRGRLSDSVRNASFFNMNNIILRKLVNQYENTGKWATEVEVAKMLNVTGDTYVSRLAHHFLKNK